MIRYTLSIECYFGDIHSQIKAEISQAKESLVIAVAWINFGFYKETFLNLKKKGVSIKIICTDHYFNRKQKELIDELVAQGIDLKLIKMPGNSNHMHHKFAVVDKSTILNGSVNWSINSEKNFENLLVIKNEPDVVRSFMLEYLKLEKLDSSAIKSLQSLERCQKKDCKGKKFNILVFSENPIRTTYEVWGDVIQLCTECGEDDYVAIEQGIQDTWLHNFLNSYDFLEDADKEYQNQFNRDVDEYLTGYSVGKNLIHAIGFVSREYYYPDDENVFTYILWKNKFVDNVILNRYESNFGVIYK